MGGGAKLRTEAEQNGSEELRDARTMWSLQLPCITYVPQEHLHERVDTQETPPPDLTRPGAP